MFKYKGKTLSVKEQKSKGLDCNWYTFKDGDIVKDELVELVKTQGGEVVEEKEVHKNYTSDKDMSADLIDEEPKEKPKRGRPKKINIDI